MRLLSGALCLRRNLEAQQLLRQDMPLASTAPAGAPLNEQPVAASATRVSAKLAELTAATAPQRLADVVQLGRRASFYAGEVSRTSSLVAFVHAQPASECVLPSFLADFHLQVERLLPGHFYFFPHHSLHVTVRALLAAAAGWARMPLLSWCARAHCKHSLCVQI